MISCDDSEECNSAAENNINGPVCCTSFRACFSIGNITTNVSRSVAPFNTALRCDGYLSCYGLNYIIAKNGGDIYFGGGPGSYDLNGAIIKTTTDSDIMCNGHDSCDSGWITSGRDI